MIHARDDDTNPFAVGTHIAESIPVAELMPLETGGHLSLRHRSEIQAPVGDFLRVHTRGAQSP